MADSITSQLLSSPQDEEPYFYSDYGTATIFLETTQRIGYYTSPLLLIVGSLGNVMSLIVLSRLSRKVLSTCLYLAVLCVTELIVLYMRCGNDWLTDVTGYNFTWNLMIRYDIMCKLLPFAVSFIFHLSKWLVVATAIEGVIITGLPQRSPY